MRKHFPHSELMLALSVNKTFSILHTSLLRSIHWIIGKLHNKQRQRVLLSSVRYWKCYGRHATRRYKHGLVTSNLLYKSQLSRQCSNYIFNLDVTPGLKGLGKDNCKTRRNTFKVWNLMCLILEASAYNVTPLQSQWNSVASYLIFPFYRYALISEHD